MVTRLVVVGGVSSLLFVTLCDSYYFRRDNPQSFLDDQICAPVYAALFPDREVHKGFPMWPITTVLAFILLIVPVTTTLIPHSWKQQQPSFLTTRQLSNRGKLVRFLSANGDPIIYVWASIIIVIPIFVIILVQATRYSEETSFMERWIKQLGKATGYCAVVSLALFMVPVSRTSPLLVAVGWSPVHAVSLHVWCGYLCFGSVLVHGFLFVNKEGLKKLFPKGHCWNPSSLLEEGKECYHQWRDFTGVISALALFSLVLTSLNVVRRKNYRFFYLSHIVFGSVTLIFAVLHFYWISLYVLPGFLYWLAYRLPVVIRQRANHLLDGGVSWKRVTFLAKSNGCAELVFARRTTSLVPERRRCPSPVHVRILVPELSKVLWHPFTVPHTVDSNDDDHDYDQDRNDEVRLLIRRTGRFTTALYNRLQQQPPPTVLVDGYHYGSDWVTSALQHDTVMIVSGGIGVTATLPFLESLLRRAKTEMRTNTTPVFFHWYCRDEGLIQYVIKEYLLPMTDSLGSVGEGDEINNFHITIHFTDREEDDPNLFVMEKEEKSWSSSSETDVETDMETVFSEGSWTGAGLDAGIRDVPCKEESGNSNCSFHFQDPTDNLVIDFTKDPSAIRGTPMKDNLCHSRLVTLVRLFAFVTAYAVYLFWYVTQVRENTKRIFFRLYSIYVAAAILLFSAVAAEIYERQYVGSNPYANTVNNFDDEEDVAVHSQCRSSEDCVPLPSLPSVVSFSSFAELDYGSNAELSQIRVNVVNGRPSLDDLVRPVVEAESPGVFYCGPQTLLHTVQQHISSSRTKAKGRLAPRCSTYEEQFET